MCRTTKTQKSKSKKKASTSKTLTKTQKTSNRKDNTKRTGNAIMTWFTAICALVLFMTCALQGKSITLHVGIIYILNLGIAVCPTATAALVTDILKHLKR
jgi:hypothetical protein